MGELQISFNDMAIINTDGSLDKIGLINNKELETTFVPMKSKSITEDKLLIYGDRVKNYKLGIIAFK
jgi:hypothetical protein